MPALITHDFFGQDVYDHIFRNGGGTRDEAEAFLLGNQGPDPLFYAVADPRLHEHNRLGNVMHSEKPSELIKAFKDSLGILDDDEQPVGRAYAFGFLCHYTLDSNMLSRDDAHEVHAVIESELDELVLFEKRGETVATFQPWREILQASDFVLGAVSKMYSYAALTVYGRIVPRDLFARSVRNFRRVQRLFYSKTGAKRALLGRIEGLVRPYSFYQSMSHRPVALTESIYDNRAHEAWENPYTGEVSTASFWDLYGRALEKAEENIDAFDRDDFDLGAARALTGELDFSGRPVVATLVSVEDGGTAHGAEGETANATEPSGRNAAASNSPAPRGA